MNPEPAPLRVRRPRPEDHSRIVAIEKVCFNDPWSAAALRSEMGVDHLRRPLVAVLDGRVEGYLMAWRVMEVLHLLNLAVDPAVRGQGVGRALLLAAAGEARAAGQERITLEVRRSNRSARDFYEGLGFVETGVRKGYYAEDGEDAVIMDVRLDDLPGS